MTTVSLTDRTPVSGLRRDSAGNLIGVAKAARTGIQNYAGYEVGKPEMETVRVYRPAEEVFARDAMRSIAGAPLTIDHPPVMVDPSNWRDYAKGETASDEIVRDGETIRVPFIIRDAEAIRQAEDEKHEVSLGYACELDFTPGQTPTGEAYDAVQRKIRINHFAIVDRARAGPDFRIGDSEKEPTMTTKPMLFDGITIQVTDAAEQAINKLTATLSDKDKAIGTLTTERDEAKTAVATKDGEIAALKTQLAEASDPSKLADAAAARSALVAKAKVLLPTVAVDGKSDDEIRKAVVDAKLGDSAKTLDAAGIAGAFAALAAHVKIQTGANDALATVIADGTASSGDVVTDLRKQRDQARQGMFDHLHGVKPEAGK